MKSGGSLAGLRAVVTGSSSGIGRAIALRLARDGAAVVVHANRSMQEAETLVRDLRAAGARAEALRADLTDPGACAGLVQAAFELLGGVDAWVNNAGADILTGSGRTLPFEAKLARLLDVDVRATMLLTRAVGARMRAAGGGGIVNMGWDQAETGMEGDSGELFAAAKAAVMSFTRSAALSLAPAVRVNCVAPGWIRTAWGEGASETWQERVRRETPLGRWGTPEDVAETVRFLASREAAFVTGQILRVNGGAVR
jgi:3-oxoacyl-[acyl-carrier protein] reductase